MASNASFCPLCVRVSVSSTREQSVLAFPKAAEHDHPTPNGCMPTAGSKPTVHPDGPNGTTPRHTHKNAQPIPNIHATRGRRVERLKQWLQWTTVQLQAHEMHRHSLVHVGQWRWGKCDDGMVRLLSVKQNMGIPQTPHKISSKGCDMHAMNDPRVLNVHHINMQKSIRVVKSSNAFRRESMPWIICTMMASCISGAKMSVGFPHDLKLHFEIQDRCQVFVWMNLRFDTLQSSGRSESAMEKYLALSRHVPPRGSKRSNCGKAQTNLDTLRSSSLHMLTKTTNKSVRDLGSCTSLTDAKNSRPKPLGGCFPLSNPWCTLP